MSEDILQQPHSEDNDDDPDWFLITQVHNDGDYRISIGVGGLVIPLSLKSAGQLVLDIEEQILRTERLMALDRKDQRQQKKEKGLHP